MSTIKTILVAGAGTMGQGIAQVCAQAGYTVYLFDVQAQFVELALENILKNITTLVNKGKLQQEEATAIVEKIKGTETVDVPADLVIEAIIEEAEAKQKLFLQLKRLFRHLSSLRPIHQLFP